MLKTIFNIKNLVISKTCSIFATSNQDKGCSWDFDKDEKQDEFFDILEQLIQQKKSLWRTKVYSSLSSKPETLSLSM